MKVFFRYLYIAVPIAIIVCVIGQMVISNQMIVYGNELGRINRRIAELEEQNSYLNQKLVEQQAIQRISLEAKRLGLVESTSYMAFTSDSYPVAIKR